MISDLFPSPAQSSTSVICGRCGARPALVGSDL
jgi:hypothetical protein